MQSEAYIFDIDGTLLNTRDLVHWNALHQAMLEVYEIDTTIEGIPYHGKTDLGILEAALARAGLSDDVFRRKLPEALLVVCREVDRNAGAIAPEICISIPDLLARLRNAHKLLGVASGNLQSVGWHKIRAAGLSDYFQFCCFSDCGCETRVEIFRKAMAEVRSRLADDATVCFVGDTPADIDAAHQLNARVIAVSTGTFSFDELAGHAPDLCIGSCKELL